MRNIGLALAAWVVLEILAFIFVAHSIGLLFALLLSIATSLIGLSDIRGLLDYLKRRAKGAGGGDSLLDGALQALGSALLILPGFASDFVGLALKSPSLRASLAQRLNGAATDPRIIDLAPGEWRHDKPKARKRTANRKAGAR